MAGILTVRLATSRTRPADLVVLGCFESEEPALEHLPGPLAEAARRAARRRGWSGRRGQASSSPVGGGANALVALHGLGPRRAFDSRALGGWLRETAARAATDGFGRLEVAPPAHEVTRGAAAGLRIQRELALAGYRFDRFLAEAEKRRLTEVRVRPPAGEETSYRRAARWAPAVAAAVARARELSDSPPNLADPTWMASQARALARERKMRIRVLGPRELSRLKMGGLLSVGRGSAAPPRLVRLEWGRGRESISIVGKGVTFDTGGISIKPSREMDEMKFDKSGACVALGVAQGAADLGLPFRFRVYLPLAENMPDGRAYRPGDVVTCYNGKTVEVLNTDAEGRMILADALSWAAREKPDVLLDYATLTGACVVALGHHAAGLFTGADDLATELLAAADSAGERLWRLPLWPEYLEDMKGRHADLRNASGRWGGANTAAAFLSSFVQGARQWAHLDIAGTAYVGNSQRGPYGATGFGVALTLTWLLQRAGKL